MAEENEGVIHLDTVEMAIILLTHRHSDFHYIMDLYYLFKERGHREEDPSEAVWLFLDAFGGKSMEIPTRTRIEECLRHVMVYIAYKKAEEKSMSSEQRNKVLRRIWRGYNLDSRREMMSIVREMDQALDQLPDKTKIAETSKSAVDMDDPGMDVQGMDYDGIRMEV